MPAKIAATRKGSAKKGGTKASGKRKLIAPKVDKRYIRRDAKGCIAESDDQGGALSRDIRQHAKKEVKPGYGDQGDQPRRKSSPKKAYKDVGS